MSSIPQQPSGKNTEFDSLGPHFFSRISKKEGNQSDDPDATPCGKYIIGVSATELGMSDIILTMGRVCANVETGSFHAETSGNDHRENVAIAVVFITEAHLKGSKKGPRSCTIEQLEVKTWDPLTTMEGFAAMLRQIQILCIKTQVEHLMMLPVENSSPLSGLLKNAGFNLCDCATFHKNVNAGFQLCMALPTRPDGSPTSKTKSLGIREWIDAVDVVETTQSATDSVPGKKLWCTHWIMTGNCKYQQVGCKYKHELPFDEETRQRIGIRDIPQWFKESDAWPGWLQQVGPAEREKLVGYGRNKNNFVTGLSGQRSGREGRLSFAYSGGEGGLATNARKSVEMTPYTAQSRYENHHQNTIAPSVGAEMPRAVSNPASNIDSAKVINTKSNRRPERDIYKPPGIVGPSGGNEVGRSTPESSNVQGSKVSEHTKGRGKRQGRYKARAKGTHQEQFKEVVDE